MEESLFIKNVDVRKTYTITGFSNFGPIYHVFTRQWLRSSLQRKGTLNRNHWLAEMTKPVILLIITIYLVIPKASRFTIYSVSRYLL